jgi:hypothetical protein
MDDSTVPGNPTDDDTRANRAASSRDAAHAHPPTQSRFRAGPTTENATEWEDREEADA